MTSAQLINQTSCAVEYFTPVEIIEAATECMGFIHLDPASCEAANMVVGASRYFTKLDDGLSRPWEAETIWLNHPFGKGELKCPTQRSLCKKESCKKRGYHIDYDIPGNAHWIGKLFSEWMRENFTQACCITYAATSEEWFRPLLIYPQCFLHGRTNYLLPSGEIYSGNTKGSVVTYLGPRVGRFSQAFSNLGTVKVEYK